MLFAFHQLPLTAMFFVVWSISTAICWLLIGLVRFAVPRLGYRLDAPLPIRDSLINACGALFALIVAFSAAGIWNDAASAPVCSWRSWRALPARRSHQRRARPGR